MNKSLLSCLSGNIIEWYEFSIFIFFSSYISNSFLSISETTTAKLIVFLIFFSGFLFRPVGALIFGVIGDIYGRKKALLYSIALMTASTCTIGLIPSYNSIGWAAPIILTFCRIFQGISGGGEFTASMVYLSEANKKWGSLSYSSAQMGLLIGSIIAFTQIHFMNNGSLSKETWRLTFLLCLPLGIFSYYIRTYLLEIFSRNQNISDNPVKGIFKKLLSFNKKEMALVFSVNSFAQAAFYTFCFLFINWSPQNSIYEHFNILIRNSLFFILLIASIQIFSKIPRRLNVESYLLIVAALFTIAIGVFVFSGEDNVKFISSVICTLLMSSYLAQLPTYFLSLFDNDVRNTGFSLSFNLSAAIFGGSAPVIINYFSNDNLFSFSLLSYFISINIFLMASIFLVNRYKAANISCTKQN